jgi:methyl-accepting chemotaxis protein
MRKHSCIACKLTCDYQPGLAPNDRAMIDESRQVMNDHKAHAIEYREKAKEFVTLDADKRQIANIKRLLDRYAQAALDASSEGVERGNAVAKELVDASQNFADALQARQDGLGAQFSAKFEETVFIVLGLILVVLLAGGALASVLSNVMCGPIGQSGGALEKLASGNFAVDVEGAHRNDEAGQLAKGPKGQRAKGPKG